MILECRNEGIVDGALYQRLGHLSLDVHAYYFAGKGVVPRVPYAALDAVVLEARFWLRSTVQTYLVEPWESYSRSKVPS